MPRRCATTVKASVSSLPNSSGKASRGREARGIRSAAMTRPRNLVVAQSGGPTPVINSSLQGILTAARDTSAIGTVYGAVHGIEGVLKEELIDLSAQPDDEIAL